MLYIAEQAVTEYKACAGSGYATFFLWHWLNCRVSAKLVATTKAAANLRKTSFMHHFNFPSACMHIEVSSYNCVFLFCSWWSRLRRSCTYACTVWLLFYENCISNDFKWEILTVYSVLFSRSFSVTAQELGWRDSFVCSPDLVVSLDTDDKRSRSAIG